MSLSQSFSDCECPGRCGWSGAAAILPWSSLISILLPGALGQGQPLPASPSPVFPAGLDHFLYGLSDELKQAHREQLFAVHREGLVDVSNK